MKLPPFKLTNWQKVLACIIVIAILAIPASYIINFNSFPVSTETSDWGTFGDFIGGILNPIISGLTLIVTVIIALTINEYDKRHHDENLHNPIKPYLTIKSSRIYTSNRPSGGARYDEYYFVYKPMAAPVLPFAHMMNQFYLKVINNGLGVAAEVSVTYEINLQEFEILLPFTDPRMEVKTSDIRTVEGENEYLTVNVNAENGRYQQNIILRKTETNYIGLINKDKKKKVPFPDLIISAFKIYEEKRKLPQPLNDFPTIKATFEYKNIYGKKDETVIYIKIIHLQDFHDLRIYRLLFNRIDKEDDNNT